jgi:hypothetical protein
MCGVLKNVCTVKSLLLCGRSAAETKDKLPKSATIKVSLCHMHTVFAPGYVLGQN